MSNTIQAAAAVASSVVAIAALVLAVIVFITQQKSEKKFHEVFKAIVVASLLATPQSAGKTLLRFLWVDRNTSRILNEAGAKKLILRARKDENINEQDLTEIKQDWVNLFDKPWTY